MKNADALVGNPKNDNSKYCLAKPGELYLVYLPSGGTTELDLTGATRQLHGAVVQSAHRRRAADGSVKSVEGGGRCALGDPPTDADEDWVVVVR